MEKILVTGCAGFIGSHVTEHLLKSNKLVYGIDNLNNYYDVDIKNNNINLLNKYDNFSFKKEDICDTKIISEFKPDKIIHLASMAGVRYSIENPHVYTKVNIDGFIHILEESVKNNVKHIVYASSSSVYGLNEKVPFSESDVISKCNSPYACSKMAMELYGRTYYQLYGLTNIGLRFFTVYGPRGRPDMAPYKFLKAIMNGNKFDKYGDGTSSRDYTYIDDIVSGVISATENKKNLNCEVYNLGNSNPINLNEFISTCENVTNRKAYFNILPNQLGDVPHTYADISKAKLDLDYNPKTSLKEGLNKTYQYMSDKTITINLSYYNQPIETIVRHIDNWKKYPEDIKKNFTFFIIDDCSKVPLVELLSDYDFEDLDLHIYRVLEDLYCNIAGVRNLGASECKTDYMVILDMDTVIDSKMANSLVELIAKQPNNENKVFKFNRKVSDNNKHEKHNQMHPAICLIRKDDYWKIGGCEEDFVGHYGCTDPSFWFRSKGIVEIIDCNNIYLQYYPDAEADIKRDKKHNKLLSEEKKKNNSWSTNFIRFKWEKLV